MRAVNLPVKDEEEVSKCYHLTIGDLKFPCSKNPSLFHIKEGPLPPSIQLFLTDLGESVLIYQLVALVVC